MKVLFLTGSRSDWGYIKPVISECKKRNIKSFLCTTNMLLLDTFGSAVQNIKQDGFKVDEEIYMSLDGYNTFTTTKSMGVLMISFTDIIKRQNPDWVVLAGDRYETLAACIVCAYTNTPIAHIQAGESSGNIDGVARHAIGKFAHLHFASNHDAANRLKKLGEEKFRIKTVGAPQLDEIKNYSNNKKLNYFKLQKKYLLPNSKKYYLVIFHSVTEEITKIKKQVEILISTLKNVTEKKIWILPNNDPGSSFIREKLLKEKNENNLIFENFDRLDFLTIMKNSIAIIGNSSSGIIEAPSFKLPSINIGRRQNKRFRAKNVIDVKEFDKKKILKAIKIANSANFKKTLSKLVNPYGDGRSSSKIVDELIKMSKNKFLLTKTLTY
jgi:GDP/UDP-N,N'-diacetylbacillosamine 2-epimerase (hydrolysing)